MDEDSIDIEMPTVPKSFEQLGILILDGSRSMLELTRGKISKADAVNGAVRDLVVRLQESRMKSNFSIAVITFDNVARLHTPITEVEILDANGDFNPVTNHGRGTEVAVALREAQTVISTFLGEADTDLPRSVVMVLMTDGESKNPDEALTVANAIRAMPRVKICTTLFARIGEPNSAAQEFLQEMAGDINAYRTVYTGEDLRKFFEATVTSTTNFSE